MALRYQTWKEGKAGDQVGVRCARGEGPMRKTCYMDERVQASSKNVHARCQSCSRHVSSTMLECFLFDTDQHGCRGEEVIVKWAVVPARLCGCSIQPRADARIVRRLGTSLTTGPPLTVVAVPREI